MARDAEHIEQCLLFDWAERASGRIPELRLMYAVPNFAGFHGSARARLASGVRAKREGRKAGVPDVFLPAARGVYHGLYIEMKDPAKRPKREGSSGGVRPDQAEWHVALRAQGYYVAVCWTWTDARDTIERYLGLGVGRQLAELPAAIRGIT